MSFFPVYALCDDKRSWLSVLIITFLSLFPLHPVNAGAVQEQIIDFNIPAQPLADALQAFTRQSNTQFLYESELVVGHVSNRLVGRLTKRQALQQLLSNSGLAFRFIDTETVTLYQASAPRSESEMQLDTLTVEGVRQTFGAGPGAGLNLTVDQIPGNIQRATGEEIRQSRALNIADYMRNNMQSVNINNYQGNPYQMDVTYRGFTASPQLGTPQGLSVFFDGIRVNEPFGDVVNWDLIPTNAISTFDVIPGSNPLYGLNTLGGALSIRTKNGFDDPGVEASFLAGSWDRQQGQLSAGGHYGQLGGFVALTGFQEDGWRDNSPSEVRQGFGKLTLRGDRIEINASGLLVGNDLIGNGLIPKEMYEERPETIFTSPDETKNNLRQFSLDGIVKVSDSFNITAQVYRRDSTRRGLNGDMYDDFEDLTETTNGRDRAVLSGPNVSPGTCQFLDTNGDKKADYVVDLNLDSILNPPFDPYPIDTSDPAFNMPLHTYYDDYFVPTLAANFPFTEEEVRMFIPFRNLSSTIGTAPPDIGTPAWAHVPLNPDECRFSSDAAEYEFGPPRNGAGSETVVNPDQSGWVEGTPIGVLTRTNIDQITHGAALQLNWNLDKHAFMIGASIDSSESEYSSAQQLALMDETRNVFAAPGEIDPIYAAGQGPITINKFDGESTTMSAYFSETFSPNNQLHMTLAGRYNYTKVKNNLAIRNLTARDLASFVNLNEGRPDIFLCPSTDPASCPSEVNANFDQVLTLPEEINNPDRFGSFVLPGQLDLREPETESFKYTHLNPSAGVSWLPTERINLFANWSQGTRAPSAIELGCAFDPTPVIPADADPEDNPEPLPRSLVDRTSACTLPNTFSGDPYLPQITARTLEAGFRLDLPKGWHWNFAAYRSNLFDDMYLISVQGRDFFDTIGRTRRQGFETGITGSVGPFELTVNYALNEATFQSDFWMASGGRFQGPSGPRSEYSGAVFNSGADLRLPNTTDSTNRYGYSTFGLIHVEPGDRIPGMPLHNLSANLTWHVTPRWNIGLNMTAHSFSYARGNENNEHFPGENDANLAMFLDTGELVRDVNDRTRTYRNSGKIPGYALFNLHTSYQIDRNFMVFAQVNNIFDNEYASAGRLGVNPFSPSTNGAIGPSGWNYNSDEWQYDTYIAPGSPRAFWLGIEYRDGGQRRRAGHYSRSSLDGSFYAGGSAGRTDGGDCDDLTASNIAINSCNDTDIGWKVFGGYQFTPNLGAEMFYADLGTYSGSGTVQGTPVSVEAEVKHALGAAATLSWPIGDRFGVFGKLGFFRWDAEGSVAAGGTSVPVVDDDGIDFTFGVGARYNLTERLAIRAEWERFFVDLEDNTENTSVDMLSAGISYSF